jgi:leucyl/phenylalanyl-tRNA--protein transferase
MSIQLLRTGVPFQSTERADAEGWVALGNDLSTERLIEAYSRGIFPWPVAGVPLIPWNSPDPRGVLFVDQVRTGRSLRNHLRRGGFEVTTDRDFVRVMESCATVPRQGARGTWIQAPMKRAFTSLHVDGYAHSVEVWRGEGDERKLVGGLYGVVIGAMFTGESMFHLEEHGSRVALLALATWCRRWGWPVIDCQVQTDNVQRLGAVEIPRRDYLDLLEASLKRGDPPALWDERLTSDELRAEWAGWDGTVGPEGAR